MFEILINFHMTYVWLLKSGKMPSLIIIPLNVVFKKNPKIIELLKLQEREREII